MFSSSFLAGEPLHIDMELALASFDSISEVNMVSIQRKEGNRERQTTNHRSSRV